MRNAKCGDLDDHHQCDGFLIRWGIDFARHEPPDYWTSLNHTIKIQSFPSCCHHFYIQPKWLPNHANNAFEFAWHTHTRMELCSKSIDHWAITFVSPLFEHILNQCFNCDKVPFARFMNSWDNIRPPPTLDFEHKTRSWLRYGYMNLQWNHLLCEVVQQLCIGTGNDDSFESFVSQLKKLNLSLSRLQRLSPTF